MTSNDRETATTTRTRRSFFKRAGKGAAVLVAAKMGLAVESAAAYNYRGCTLCYAPSGCTGCASTWCWHACDSNGYGVMCCECYSSGYPANGGCGGVYCSFVYDANPNCFR